MNILLEYYI